MSTKVGMISLGCAKNLVDAEIMLGSVLARGMEITSSADEADVLVVNTCAFIDSAKEESIEAILSAHRARGLNTREGQKLIVSGCMSQRFARDLQTFVAARFFADGRSSAHPFHNFRRDAHAGHFVMEELGIAE